MEEAGLEAVEPRPEIWTRTHLWDDGINWDGQAERYFLVRTPAFEPVLRHTSAISCATGPRPSRSTSASEPAQPRQRLVIGGRQSRPNAAAAA